jgi:glucosamine-6-phosphate deaminase
VHLISARSSEEFARVAAQVVATIVAAKATLTITLPTGATPLPLYERLRTEHAAGTFSLDEARVFMLDEYADLADYPAGSFLSDLRRHLGPVIFNDRTTVHSIRPSPDPSYCLGYDAALDAAGGLDLAVVGVGRNGHVGFNEPGTSVNIRTHVVALTDDTLRANFPDVDDSARPTRAVTMGLSDLRRARSVLMLVRGDKRRVAQLLAEKVVAADVPATQLLDHPDLTIVVDEHLL